MYLKKHIPRLNKKNNRITFSGITFDSTKVKKNYIFFAIRGNNVDGNNYIDQAIKKGASLIISSRLNKKYKNKILQVNNVITFLNEFALLKRSASSAKIIAITGSVGKTSLKNLLRDQGYHDNDIDP